MTASRVHSGMTARCTICSAILTLPGTISPPDATEKTDSQLSDKEAETSHLCSACGEAVSLQEGISCRFCRALYHLPCFAEKGGCTVPTCESGPRQRRALKAAKTKDSLKACPACAELIPDRAHRCRHCGEYTDSDKRHIRRQRIPTKTSNLAGISLILGLISIILMMVVPSTSLYLLLVLLPLTGLGFGIWATVDIKAAAGTKSGSWVAGIGITLNSIAFLTWLVNIAG